MATINPCLSFSDNCEAAFNFYKAIFGGDFASFQRFKDAPSEWQLPASEGEKIMHVSLPIGPNTVLMGNDTSETTGKVTSGNNVSISISTDDDEETARIFNGLAADGQVAMPLQQTFWSPRFGMLTDKFGIHWIVNQEQSPSK
jgi:PhnB protein